MHGRSVDGLEVPGGATGRGTTVVSKSGESVCPGTVWKMTWWKRKLGEKGRRRTGGGLIISAEPTARQGGVHPAAGKPGRTIGVTSE